MTSNALFFVLPCYYTFCLKKLALSFFFGVFLLFPPHNPPTFEKRKNTMSEAKLTWPQFNKLYAKEHNLTFAQALHSAGEAWKDYSSKFNERNPPVPGAPKRKIIRKKPNNIPHKRVGGGKGKEKEEKMPVEMKKETPIDDDDYDYIEERTVVKKKSRKTPANPEKKVQPSEPPPKKKRKRSPSSSNVHDSVFETLKSHPPSSSKKNEEEDVEEGEIVEENHVSHEEEEENSSGMEEETE